MADIRQWLTIGTNTLYEKEIKYFARLGDLPQVNLQSSNEVETNRPNKYCWKERLESSGDKGFVYHLEKEIGWIMAWTNGTRKS